MSNPDRLSETATAEFSFADIDPTSGKRVGETLFADLSQWHQSFVFDVLGIPAGQWDSVVTSGALAGSLEHCESMTYVLPHALRGGAR